MDAARILLIAALAGAGFIAWRRGALDRFGLQAPGRAPALVLVPPPASTPTPGPTMNPPAPINAPRGIRNNNPGNIRWSADAWQGAIPRAQATDSQFVQFTAAKWGIRALARTLLTYQSKHGLSTLAAIVGRWAPPVENNTAAYVDAVSRAIGQAPDVVLDLYGRPDLLRALVAAIIRHENGVQPYTVDALAEGIAAAL